MSELLENYREIAQNAKSCSTRKTLLEIREVAKTLPSNLWKALAAAVLPLENSRGRFFVSKFFQRSSFLYS